MSIIDRRLNPGGKSLANRQRFIRRARALVRRAVHDASAGRSIKDAGKGGDVVIPADGVHEPTLRRSSQGGARDYLLPGNKKFIEGDNIQRPQQGGGGRGGDPSDDGEGEDDFRFALTAEEFLDLFLEDLELPDMAKREVAGEANFEWRRAGYTTSGSPSALSVSRTMRHSMSRRIALRRPKPAEIAELEEKAAAFAEDDQSDAAKAARDALAAAKRRAKLIPFIDPIDVRYRRLESNPKPSAQAVMFCLMDVSGSMNEHMKDLAKRFYTLLYLFLKKRYKRVEVVFIRHTHVAQEVDEETFFYSRETGGTVVSTVLEEMKKVVDERFPPDVWNIYAAQASDGDNTSSDNPKSAALLTEVILPLCQYFAYVEVGDDEDRHPAMMQEMPTSLWRTYARVAEAVDYMAMKKVRHRRDIYPVFRELFSRESMAALEAVR
jgi:uncharacterized sporulation protein YeaH/YhbH (DUF444 family)